MEPYWSSTAKVLIWQHGFLFFKIYFCAIVIISSCSWIISATLSSLQFDLSGQYGIKIVGPIPTGSAECWIFFTESMSWTYFCVETYSLSLLSPFLSPFLSPSLSPPSLPSFSFSQELLLTALALAVVGYGFQASLGMMFAHKCCNFNNLFPGTSQ